MKVNLKEFCLKFDFEKLFKAKGYAWFKKGAYNLNIIGVRASSNKINNLYDDVIVIDYCLPSGAPKRVVYSITTEPGLYYMNNPMNQLGTALLAPGQYRGAWKLGLHKGKYKALCQCKPVTVYRDGNKNDTYDANPETATTGLFGINIHRSNEKYTSKKIDKWSAGCQVFADPIEFNAFMRLCDHQKANFGNSFTYTLIKEEDLY